MPDQSPLAAVWSQVVQLIKEGYSLIPVRDKANPITGRPAKSPYAGWKKHQSTPLGEPELWHQMADQFNTEAVAMICGRVSGNLEVIDIDVKHMPGVDARFFSAIQQLYPDLWARLRLHKSPSGGYHIPYKIVDQPPPGNQKIAGVLQPGAVKPNYFLETRGEGGYVLVPPSLGYSVYKPEPIPTLTWAERSSLVALAGSFNEYIKPERLPAPPKREEDYYDLDPFTHFNQSPAAAQVLQENGWQPNGSNSEFIWFMRPGSKSGERHAAFIRSKQLFYFWTTNEVFEAGRCYLPTTVLATLQHGGDFKATYRALVANGYGKIKPEREAAIVRYNAASGQPAPGNLSPTAQATLEAARITHDQRYPHGTFWSVTGNPGQEAFHIEREGLLRVSAALGFYTYDDKIIQLDNYLLRERTERQFFDQLKDYIQEEDADLYDTLAHAYEAFIQTSGRWTTGRLPLLEDNQLLQDDPVNCYKFYEDVWVHITGEGYTTHPYQAIPGFIWATRVQSRPFAPAQTGRYIDFLERAVEFSQRPQQVLTLIGFLAHEYKDETTGYIPVLSEQCVDPAHGGGSGKNIFCNLLAHTTTITTKPGSQVKYDEKFLQSWNGERLFIVSDVPKNFDFLFLKELSTGNGLVKKLWKDERTITPDKMPKLVLQTNYSYDITDGGLKRRIVPLEFTDFFTKCGGVDVHYNVHFPRGWTTEDWAGYDYTIVAGVRAWLKSKLKVLPAPLTSGGWHKQFEQTYGHHAAEFVYEYWPKWMEERWVSSQDFKNQLQEYCNEFNIPRTYQPSIFKLNKAIEEYARKMNVVYDAAAQQKVNGINTKGKTFFTQNEAPPF